MARIKNIELPGEKHICISLTAIYGIGRSLANKICDNAGVQDFEIIPFSIGSVFAKKLGRFNADNTDEILNKLILKTPSEKGCFFRWLKS